MKKIFKIIIILVVVALLVALAIRTIKHKKMQEAQTPTAKNYAIVVDTIKPKVQEVTLTLPALAEVINDQDVAIMTKVSARVKKILPSGTKVAKGDILVKLDTTDIDALISSVSQDIKASEIALNNLLQTHKRTKELYAVKGASIEQLQQERSKIAALRAKLQSLRQKRKALKNNLTYATIKAPSSGVVSKTFASQGSIAMPGKPLLKLSAKSGQSLIVRLPANLKAKALRYEGKEVPLVALDTAFGGLKEYKAYINEQTLAVGERIGVDLVLYHDRGIVLPFDTILDRDGKSYIVEIQNNHAKPLQIHPTISASEGILVDDKELTDKHIAVAKPDLLLRLLGGASIVIKEK